MAGVDTVAGPIIAAGTTTAAGTVITVPGTAAVGIAGITLEQQIRALLPFIFWGIVTLLFITYIPWLSLAIPSYFN